MRIWKAIKHELLAPINAHDRVGRFWARLVGATALSGSILAAALTAWFLYRAFRYRSSYADPVAILFLVSTALIAVSGLVVAVRLLRAHNSHLLSSLTLAVLGVLFLAISLMPFVLTLDLFGQHPLHTTLGLLSSLLFSGLCFLAATSRRGA
jgi:hypothetical protein